MDAKELPTRPNLEQYKKQAKDLLKPAIQEIRKPYGASGNSSVVQPGLLLPAFRKPNSL